MLPATVCACKPDAAWVLSRMPDAAVVAQTMPRALRLKAPPVWLEADDARRSAATMGSITAAATASSSESSISSPSPRGCNSRPSAVDSAAHRLAPKGGLGGDEVTGKLAEQEARLPQGRANHDGEAAFQNRPGSLERRHCALATLSRRIEEQTWRSREQHIALPGIEGQLGDALGPGDGIVERGGLSWCQSCERAAEQGQLALESGGAHEVSVASPRAKV